MGGCLAQLGCSGEVRGTSVGFVIAFSVPAPFRLEQSRAARPACLCPALRPGHGTEQCLPDPASALIHHLYKYYPGPLISPLGLFVLTHSFLVHPK